MRETIRPSPDSVFPRFEMMVKVPEPYRETIYHRNPGFRRKGGKGAAELDRLLDSVKEIAPFLPVFGDALPISWSMISAVATKARRG